MKTNNSVPELPFKSLEFSSITEEIRLRAEKELNETEENRRKCLEEFRILIKDEEHLVANTTDEFLLQFLRAKKFRTKAAFNLLKKFYHHRVLYPKVYKDYSPRQNLKVLKANLLNFLPLRTAEDCAIWVTRAGLWDVEAFDYERFLRFGLLCTEMELKNPVTQISGIVSIVDFQGFSWTHLFHMPTSSVKCFVNASQDSLPIRHKAIHIINNPAIFGLFFAILKPFLSAKIKNRIHLHGYNLDSLHQFVPPSILPKEFGGTLGPFQNEKFYTSLLNIEEEFLASHKYGYKI